MKAIALRQGCLGLTYSHSIGMTDPGLVSCNILWMYRIIKANIEPLFYIPTRMGVCVRTYSKKKIMFAIMILQKYKKKYDSSWCIAHRRC
jgi:hypothetical protein